MKTAYLLIVATAVLWSGMEVALKFVAGDFNPIQLTFTRVLIGGAILFPLARRSLKKRGRKLDGAALCRFAALGFLGIAVSMSINQLAVMYAPATVVSSIAVSNPIFTAAFAALILREPVSKWKLMSLLLAIVGIVVIIAPWNLELSLPGVLYSLLAPLTFSLYGVLSRRDCERYGGATVTSFCFVFGALELMAFAALSHIPGADSLLRFAGLDIFASIPFLSGYTLEVLPYFLYIAVGATGIGFCCYFSAMEKSTALHASLAFFLKPVMAPVYAFFLLGERIEENVFAGIVIMLACLALFVLPELVQTHKKDKARRAD